MQRLIFTSLFLFSLATPTLGDQVYLKNGDKITGEIIADESKALTIQTDGMGEITIQKAHIKKTMTDEEIMAAKGKTKREEQRLKQSIAIGITDTQGNTDKNNLSFEYKADLEREVTTWTGRLTAFRSSTDRKEDERKYYGLIKRSRHLGTDGRWEYIAKFEGEQDRFANVDYRLTPSTGYGYWFKKRDDFKLMAEGLVGFERTVYRDDSKPENSVVLVPHALFEKVIIGNLTFREDITLYPSLEDLEKYRFRAETVFSQPILDNLQWKLKFIAEHDSQPKGETKKNDTHLIFSLEYLF